MISFFINRNLDKNKGKNELLKSNKVFEKSLKISLIIGIITVSGFIIYFLLNPEPGFVTFGILNSEKEAGNYPTTAKVGENVSFYVTVQNQMERDFSFRVEILRGDNKTILTSTGSIGAESYFNTSKITLLHNQFWMSEMLNVSLSQPGANQSIIAEFWETPSSGVDKFYIILYLILNILP